MHQAHRTVTPQDRPVCLVMTDHGLYSVDGARQGPRFAEARAKSKGRKNADRTEDRQMAAGLAVLAAAALAAWLYIAPPN
jgi:hypothetical protein